MKHSIIFLRTLRNRKIKELTVEGGILPYIQKHVCFYKYENDFLKRGFIYGDKGS